MAGQPILTSRPADAASLRRQAGDLLGRLMADREALDRRLAESGKRDAIRTITGASAIEQAIAATRDMIARMDLMLGQLDAGIQALNNSRSTSGVETERPRIAAPNRHRSRGMLPGRQLSVAATS